MDLMDQSGSLIGFEGQIGRPAGALWFAPAVDGLAMIPDSRPEPSSTSERGSVKREHVEKRLIERKIPTWLEQSRTPISGAFVLVGTGERQRC
jgi:hypothetical protein